MADASNLQKIAGALRDAHRSVDRSAGLRLPWEHGPLRLVFGDPQAPGEVPLIRPPAQPSVIDDKQAELEQVPHDVQQAIPVFSKFAVKKLDGRPAVSQSDKEDLMAQRFEVLLSHHYA